MMFSGSVGSISLPDDDDAKALRTEERMAFHVLVGWGDTTPWVRNLGTPMALWLGASCGLGRCETRLGPSGVSIVLSWVSKCPELMPDDSEHIMFRVGGRLSPFFAPRETWECR